MHIYIRKSLLFISYTAFVIIAPLVILYAIGYRPQTSSPIPRSVGVILADASPNGAQVAINNIPLGTLPRSIPNIDPGTVSVEIMKDGYTSWKKQLEVKPTQATDIRSVHLLPSAFDTTILATNIAQFESSPNNLLIAVTTIKNTLAVYDDTGLMVIPEEKLFSRPTAISWSPDSSHILVTFPKNSYQLFSVTNGSLTKVPSKNLTGFTSIHWSPIAANAIYALDKNRSLVEYTTTTENIEIISKEVNIFTIASRTLYYQTFESKLGEMQLRSKDTRTLVKDTAKAIKKITATGDGLLALLFVDGELAIRASNGDYTTISTLTEDMSWSPDGQLLLVQTSPTELSIYNVENERLFSTPLKELHLITRLTQPITNARWFPDSLHILYESNGALLFSEIDTRDHPISQPIDDAKAPGHLVFGDESKSIFYLQKNNKEINLVQTWLVTKADR
ncbi:MAG: PEGA domain-containing protein [bacterium]|nr:PEGA domain-containing protein [bacterium]